MCICNCEGFMTKKELSQLYYLNREIEQLTKQLKDLQQKRKIQGLPYIDTEDIQTEIEDCKITLKTKQKKAMKEYNRLVKYIDGIDDSLSRQIIGLRYINGLSWKQVAFHIGGGNTPDSVRKVHDRWLLKNKSQNKNLAFENIMDTIRLAVQ